jgi:ABC-type glycerol-3-phosphate transport system substrate-binding protein
MAKSISRRHFLKAMGGTAMAGALAACAAPVAKPPEAATTEKTEATPAPAAAGEKVHLKWDTFRAPGTGWNEERITTFVEKNPNIEIEFRPLTGASQQDNYGKMYAQFAAGDLGDVCAFDPSHFHFWRAIDKNIIGPLDELIKGDSLDLSQWFKTFIDLQVYKGQTFGLPSWGWAGYDTIVMNAVHLKEAGITPPDPVSHDTSMETYAEWAHKLTKPGERFGLALNYGEALLVTLARTFNGDLIDAEGKKCLLADDKNAQEGLRWAYKLAVEEKLLPRAADAVGTVAAMLDGKLSMLWSGSLDVRNVKRGTKDAAKTEAWQGLLPTRKDGKPPTQIRGGTWNMLKTTKYPNEVFQFLKHITNSEGCIGFNLVAGQGALVRPDALQELVKQDVIHEWFIPNLETGMLAHAPANSRGREYTDAVGQWAAKMMDPTENIPFEKGLQDLHDNIQKVLDMEPA